MPNCPHCGQSTQPDDVHTCSPQVRALDLDAMEAHIAAANKKLERLCDGERFSMSVPARPDEDADLIFARAFGDASRLVAALRAAQQDAKRLDWLERQHDGVHAEVSKLGTINNVHSAATVYTFMNEYRADNLRNAIDAAMQQEAP